MVNEYYVTEDKNRYVSKNFQVWEFACKDGTNKVLIDTDILDILQKVRDKFGIVDISSAYRTPSHNKNIGGASNSYHIYGKAVDFRCRNYKAREILLFLEDLGVKGIEMIDENYIHIDSRPSKWYGVKTGDTYETIDSFYSHFNLLKIKPNDIITVNDIKYTVKAVNQPTMTLELDIYKRESEMNVPFKISVYKDNVLIKAEPNDNSATKTICPKGIYTIIDVQNSYGKLKSGAGWIEISKVLILNND